jgi:hypothetical protein
MGKISNLPASISTERITLEKSEKPLKEIVRQNNFLGLSSKNGSPRD